MTKLKKAEKFLFKVGTISYRYLSLILVVSSIVLIPNSLEIITKYISDCIFIYTVFILHLVVLPTIVLIYYKLKLIISLYYLIKYRKRVYKYLKQQTIYVILKYLKR